MHGLLPWWLPIPLTGLVVLVLLAWTYYAYGGDVEAIFHVGNPRQGTGYDGQFVYFMARELHPKRVAAHLDVPAYRYQRILLPALAHFLTQGEPKALLFAVWGLSLAGHLLGVAAWSHWVRRWGAAPWWGLLYGLWPGLLLPLRIGMTEPLAYGLALAGLWAVENDRWKWAGGLLLAAALTKELTLGFTAAGVLALGFSGKPRAWKKALALAGLVGLPWLAWQGWLWFTFGTPGLGIGGLGAEPPPPVPFGGLIQAFLLMPNLWRVAYILVFGPSLLLPLVLGLVWAIRRMRQNRADPWAWLLLGHALLSAVLPLWSWDPFAAPRIFIGFMTAFWALALQDQRLGVLRRLTPFWAALLAFVVAE